MFIIYDFIFLVFTVFYLPIYLFKGKFHRGFSRRLGILPKGLELNRPIWIHAVSVGEVMLIKGLLLKLRREFPDKKFVISTVTATGNKIARGFSSTDDFTTYLPLDFSFIINYVLDKIKPGLFIIAETEIWPNLITALYKKNIPAVIINGRISDGSFRGYLMLKFLLRPILNKIDMFCAQTQVDRQRLLRLGVSEGRIKVTGNMKFDGLPEQQKSGVDYRQKLCLKPEEKLLIAASTHPGEEEIILSAYKNLLFEFCDLRLLIAPRHPERAKEIENLLLKNGFQSALISRLNLTPNTCHLKPIFILDTIGELLYFYALADIVFVGGSLIKKGGHNILEPVAQGKPVLFGPYMFNFRALAELFLKRKAGILVHNAKDLQEKIKYLFNNPLERNKICSAAKQIISENQGATQRNLEILKNIYEKVPL